MDMTTSRTASRASTVAIATPSRNATEAQDVLRAEPVVRLVRCARAWADLRDTGHPDVRYCDTCARSVFRARDVSGFWRLAASDRCVGVRDAKGTMTVGVPANPTYDSGEPLDWPGT